MSLTINNNIELHTYNKYKKLLNVVFKEQLNNSLAGAEMNHDVEKLFISHVSIKNCSIMQ